MVTDDPYIDFDREGQFVPFDFAPDTYQVWCIKTPEIAVRGLPAHERLTTGGRYRRSPTGGAKWSLIAG